MRALRRFLIRLTHVGHEAAGRRAAARGARGSHRAADRRERPAGHAAGGSAASGACSSSARREALREDYRDEQSLPLLEHLLQDARMALRRMKQAPGFTAAAVAILALGLGLTSAVASLAYALFLKPLPVDDASQVVFVGPPENARRGFPGAFPDYLYYRDHARVFAHLAAHYSTSPMNVVTPAGPFNASGAVVTANYFDLLRLKPAIGRFFLPDEDRVPGRNPVAVLSHDLWRTKFGADAGILGTSVRINGTAFTVVGIAPEGFHGILSGLTPNDVWIPSAMFGVGYRYCDGLARGCNVIGMVGRLDDRVSIQEAQAEMAVLARQLDSTFTGGVEVRAGPRRPDPGAGAGRADRRAAGWRRRARADHRVGQRRRAVARARPPPPEGDRDPPGPGRQPRPRDSSAARRVRRAGAGRQRGGIRRGDLGDGYPARVFRRRRPAVRSTSISRSTCASCWRASASPSSPACSPASRRRSSRRGRTRWVR